MTSFHSEGLGPLTKLNTLSLHQLSKLNHQEDYDLQRTLYAKEDLKKQKKSTHQNTLAVQKQIKNVSDQAVELTRVLQEQKIKWSHLNTLLKQSQQEIYNSKLQMHKEIMNKKQPDQLEQNKKILAQKQNKLQKILQKVNSSQFQASKKMDIIRSLRSERGVFSNIFDKLQKQHFELEFYYKQLLIERTLTQKVFKQVENEFSTVSKKSNKQMQNINFQHKNPSVKNGSQLFNRESVQIDKTQNQGVQNRKMGDNLFRQSLNLSLSNSQIVRQRKQANTSKRNQQKNIQLNKKLQCKRKVKQILHSLGCVNIQQLKGQKIFINVKQNQNLFQNSNQIYNSIFKLQSEINCIQQQLNQRQNLRQNIVSRKKISLQTQIHQFQKETLQTKNQVLSFKDNLKQLFDPKSSQNLYKTNYEQEKDLTFMENYQILKQSMAYFNDEALQSYFYKQKSEPRMRMIRKNSISMLKKNKLSNFNFQKKVKIVRTETQCSQVSTKQLTNKYYLQTILNMHLDSCSKNQKLQRYDKLSIMTEQDFIDESKRIIKQATKKKSQFIKTPSISRK